MKLKLKLLFNLWLLPATLFCQSNIFSGFNGSQSNKSVYLIFTVRGGSTCQGIGIEHSADALVFNRIGEIIGVCGGSNSDVTYTFTDLMPVANKINYYRLEAGINSRIYSETITVNHVDYGAYGFLVFPNPASDKTKIYFSNLKNELIDFLLFNYNGKLVKQKSVKEGFIELDAVEFLAGIYLFQLQLDGEVKHRGKIVFL